MMTKIKTTFLTTLARDPTAFSKVRLTIRAGKLIYSAK
jgi:hypothetical protein